MNGTWAVVRYQEVSRQTPRSVIHLTRGTGVLINDVGNNESRPGLGIRRGILCSLMEWKMHKF